MRRSRSQSDAPAVEASALKQQQQQQQPEAPAQQQQGDASKARLVAQEALDAFEREHCHNHVKETVASVFAAFVMEMPPSAGTAATFRTVSIGVGTHVVGLGTADVAAGRSDADAALCLHDMHAEVLARRGLVAYLLRCCQGADSKRSADGNPIIVNDSDGTRTLRDGVRFHLFVTQTPCGDASVFPGAAQGARCFRALGDAAASSLGEHEERLAVAPVAVSKHLNGVDDELERVARLKPGRGPRSTSMSCSDKIGKWIALGLQGGAAGTVLPRIDIASIVVLCDGDGEGADKPSGPLAAAAVLQRLSRAFVQRIDPAVLLQCGRPRALTPVAVAAVPLRRPFMHTAEGGGATSPICLVGHATAAAANAPLDVRVVTGKDGAPQGSVPWGRNAVYAKATAAADEAPKSELSVSRRGMLRAVLQAAPRPAGTTAGGGGGVVSLHDVKASNASYAASKAVFQQAAPFDRWMHDPGTVAVKQKIKLKR